MRPVSFFLQNYFNFKNSKYNQNVNWFLSFHALQYLATLNYNGMYSCTCLYGVITRMTTLWKIVMETLPYRWHYDITFIWKFCARLICKVCRERWRYAVAQFVEALWYKLEGRGFDSIVSLELFIFMALGLAQHLTETSTWNIFLGMGVVGKGSGCVRLTALPPSCADCLKTWELQPLGTLRSCSGL